MMVWVLGMVLICDCLGDHLGVLVQRPEVSHALLMNPWLNSVLVAFDNLWTEHESVPGILASEIKDFQL